MLQGCRLFKQCWSLPAGHCVAGVQTISAMSEPTCWALCCRGADCLSSLRTYLWLCKRCRNLPARHCVTCSDAGCYSSIGTYLPGIVLQGCRLFKQCWSLPAGHCVAGVQTISAMSEPTCWALCCSGAGCLRSVGTYLPGTVLQGCRLYKRCPNLPAGQCLTVVRAV